MRHKIQHIPMLIILVLLIFNRDAWADPIFFKNIAINQVEQQIGKQTEIDLVIRPYTMKHDPSKLDAIELIPSIPEYGEPIWTITPQQLPMTEDICIMAGADLCKDHDGDYMDGLCIHSCISGGAEVLAFDQRSGNLYLSAGSTAIGTGGGPYFLFAANINKKEIKFIKTEYGPFNGHLSADGKLLVMDGWNSIAIYNLATGKELVISEENDWNYPHQRLHYLGDIHWLSDTQFSYQDGIRHSKFQPSFDEMKENVYDIPSQKIIRTRIMAKTEYNSSPFTAMD